MAKIDFKKPRQKQWGILQNNNLIQKNYSEAIDSNGTPINTYTSNCYEDVLEEARQMLALGISVDNLNIVEFVPYDFVMGPRV